MTKPKAAISKKATAPPAKIDESTQLNVVTQAGKSREQQMAELAISPVVSNAVTTMAFAKANYGALNLNAMMEVMTAKAEKVKTGDLSELEATLAAQAMTLDRMFNDMAQRAALNVGAHLNATETYLRLAFKAQAQCRATIETLAEVKYPKSATFIKQANIAQHQQVNNGATTEAASSRTEKVLDQSNELLEAHDGERLDTRATGEASGSNPHMETLGKIDRASD